MDNRRAGDGKGVGVGVGVDVGLASGPVFASGWGAALPEAA
jgi:hypothetical protein